MVDPLSPPANPAPQERKPRRGRFWLRALILLLSALALGVVGFTNDFLTERFTDSVRNRSDLRLALYSGSVESELQRTAVVPILLARDPTLIGSLNSGDFSTTSQRLMTAQQEIAAAFILLLDATGRTVGATDRNLLGTNHSDSAYFVDALRSRDTVFTLSERESAGYEFTHSRAVMSEGKPVGVVVVGTDLARFERDWGNISDAVAVLDSEGKIILATEPKWRGLLMSEALAVEPPRSAIARAIQATTDWANRPPDAYVRGVAVMRADRKIPFRGWRIVSFSTYDSVRERVNAFLALEIMGFAILLALAFYVLSRRARLQSAMFRRESAELRQLNLRLQQEIAER
ncbi:MAG: hypothetical protein RLZZ528_2014, partial [Pseudomonadota bacterium]